MFLNLVKNGQELADAIRRYQTALYDRVDAQIDVENAERRWQGHDLGTSDLYSLQRKYQEKLKEEMCRKLELVNAERSYMLEELTIRAKLLTVEAKIRQIDITGKIE